MFQGITARSGWRRGAACWTSRPLNPAAPVVSCGNLRPVADMRTLPYGSAGVPIRTLAVEILEGADAGASRMAESDTLTVGTPEGNDLLLADPTVSPYPPGPGRRPDGILVTDAGSLNGTFCGPVRIERATVPPGTQLRLGKTTLRVGDGQNVTLELHRSEALAGLYGRTPIMRRLLLSVERA